MNSEEKIYPSNPNIFKIERDTVDHNWTAGRHQHGPGMLGVWSSCVEKPIAHGSLRLGAASCLVLAFCFWPSTQTSRTVHLLGDHCHALAPGIPCLYQGAMSEPVEGILGASLRWCWYPQVHRRQKHFTYFNCPSYFCLHLVPVP